MAKQKFYFLCFVQKSIYLKWGLNSYVTGKIPMEFPVT